MTSRRTLLFGAAGLVIGTQLSAGCRGNSRSDVSVPTSARPPSDDRAGTVESTNAPPPTRSTDVATVVEAREPWQGADFAALDEFLEQTAGEAFAITEGGVTIHEWYRTDSSYARDIASAQKSMLSLLVGRAIGDGLLALDTVIDDILGSAWTPHGNSAGITVAQLLSMTSGLDDSYAAVAEPGAAWRYSGAFASLFDVLAEVTGRDLNDIAAEWLFEPAGTTSSMFYDRRGTAYAPIGLRSTVPDLVALGSLVLNGGPSGLADGWLTDSFAASQPFNRSYGYLWWLLGGESFMLPGPRPIVLPGPMVPSAPADMVAALGKDDQKLYLSSALDLVVARLGGSGSDKSEAARSAYDIELWSRLSALRG